MTQKIQVELLADGNYHPEDIKLNVSHEPLFTYDKNLQDKLDSLWVKQLADAKEKDGLLVLNLGLVEYRNQVGIVLLFEAGEIGSKMCSPLMY